MNQEIKQLQGGRSLLKAILQAIAILAITAGLSQALLFPLFQGALLESVQRWEVEYLNGGTVELLAAELNSVSVDRRPDQLARWAPGFGFAVTLQDLKDIDLDVESMARLRNSDVVGDPSTYSAYRLLDDSRQVLVFDKTKETAAHLVTEAQRGNMGTLLLLENLLRNQPQETWTAIIEAASGNFGYPVDLATAADLDLTKAQLAELEAGRIVTIATEDSITADYPAELVYKKFADNALVLGPFSPPTLRRFYPVISAYYIILGLVVLIPLVLWLAPTWRSMNQLSNATAAFGQGNFAARAAPIRGSKSNHLIDIFNQMAGKIQSLVQSNKALINAVSHELRTPISRIEFNIELARQSTDIEERNRQLGRIEHSVDQLKTMVAEMLQYARFDREKPSFTMESVQIGEWLQSERENWRNNDAGPDIQVILPDGTFPVALERYYMSRAISNLVLNAARFAKSSIKVSAVKIDDYCEISVSDDGPGVDYQERTRIFEPFVRRDESRNRDSGGTGLGLAIVRQIASWHTGEVWVEDSDMAGAKFVLRWPLTERS